MQTNRKLSIFQVDAFADKAFSGNPAAVIPLEKWLPDELMQQIAAENNLSETAFFIPAGNGFHLRWFTPVTEVNLCGHATLATAHVLFNHLEFDKPEIRFLSKSGPLMVKKRNELIELNFPASGITETKISDKAESIFGLLPQKCFAGNEDIMYVFKSEEEVRRINPDFSIMKSLETRGIIATSHSTGYDFVSRFFAPAEGIDEDPVTGSAHTVLVPYWASRLGKNKLVAKQISHRGGILDCTHLGNRVLIAGNAVTYLTGTINL